MACPIKHALHWRLDVSFREDVARNRKDNGSTNIAILRRCALDLARQMNRIVELRDGQLVPIPA